MRATPTYLSVILFVLVTEPSRVTSEDLSGRTRPVSAAGSHFKMITPANDSSVRIEGAEPGLKVRMPVVAKHKSRSVGVNQSTIDNSGSILTAALKL